MKLWSLIAESITLKFCFRANCKGEQNIPNRASISPNAHFQKTRQLERWQLKKSSEVLCFELSHVVSINGRRVHAESPVKNSLKTIIKDAFPTRKLQTALRLKAAESCSLYWHCVGFHNISLLRSKMACTLIE